MARTELDPHSMLPLYAQLAEHLRGRIARGEFSADQRIPSKADLCGQYRVPSREPGGRPVSLRTVDTAINVLKAAGVLAPTPGKRMFILPPEERNGRTPRRRSTDR